MSKTIENIRLYRINNGAHYHFMETVAAKAKADEKVKAKAVLLVTALEQAVKTENDNLLLSQKSAQSDAIAEADRQHDNFYRGYRNGVKSFLSFPDGMRQAVAKQLWQHMADYKIDPRMQLDRETGLLTNFIEDLVSDRGADVAALSLVPFVESMKTANDTVRPVAPKSRRRAVKPCDGCPACRAPEDRRGLRGPRAPHQRLRRDRGRRRLCRVHRFRQSADSPI